jgi:hypothetical protein
MTGPIHYHSFRCIRSNDTHELTEALQYGAISPREYVHHRAHMIGEGNVLSYIVIPIFSSFVRGLGAWFVMMHAHRTPQLATPDDSRLSCGHVRDDVDATAPEPHELPLQDLPLDGIYARRDACRGRNGYAAGLRSHD